MDEFLLRALAAGLGVAAVTGPLGSFVVWNRMAFFGDTLAHSTLLGLALGIALRVEPILAILAVSVLTALLLASLQRERRLGTDTLLAVLAHGMLALGLVIVAFQRTVRVDLMGYLFGDILAVGRFDLGLVWAASLGALGLLLGNWRRLLSLTVHEDLARVEGVNVGALRLSFMLKIAVVVAVSIKVVGLLPIAGLLVIPAATARAFARTPEQMAWLAALLGCGAVVLGLLASLAWDTPSGPSVVTVAVLGFALSRIKGGFRIAPPW